MKTHTTAVQNYLIIISAPSGGGKTTLCKKLLEDFPTLRPSISSTTRQPRGTEKNGEDYFFLSHADFKEQIQKGQFAEWAQVHDHYYGTSKAVIEETLNKNHSLLLVIDVQGAKQLRDLYKRKCFSIFISPPSLEVLEARLRARGTDPEAIIQKRLLNAETEIKESSHFDAVVTNNTIDQAYSELKSLLKTKLKLPTKELP